MPDQSVFPFFHCITVLFARRDTIPVPSEFKQSQNIDLYILMQIIRKSGNEKPFQNERVNPIVLKG